MHDSSVLQPHPALHAERHEKFPFPLFRNGNQWGERERKLNKSCQWRGTHCSHDILSQSDWSAKRNNERKGWHYIVIIIVFHKTTNNSMRKCEVHLLILLTYVSVFTKWLAKTQWQNYAQKSKLYVQKKCTVRSSLDFCNIFASNMSYLSDISIWRHWHYLCFVFFISKSSSLFSYYFFWFHYIHTTCFVFIR